MPHLRHFSAGKIWSVSVVVEKWSVRSYSAVEQSFGYGMGKVYVQGKLSPTSSTDSKLALDLLQLILLEKTRMGAIAHVNLPLIGPQMPNDILRLEAVFNLPNLLQPNCVRISTKHASIIGLTVGGRWLPFGPPLRQ
jgi:hypothetical protein